jgi:glycosyltransferase involved in cell wall biosynthesis
MDRPQRVAIVHEWFTSMRGGEKCVEVLCEVFPGATLFALVHDPGSVSAVIERMPLHTSFIQKLPFSRERYRHYLPLFPAAVSRFDLRDFDCVISSSHCVAKGVRTAPGTLHLCYCYTPMRYIWGLYDDYFGKERAGLLTRMGMGMAVGYLRRWDVRTAAYPHHFIAISENVRQRIREIYGRSSDLIYPPVDTSRFAVSARDDGFYLIVSALVPYKRVDLAVEAFNRSGERLLVVGDGPDLARLRHAARANVEFLGWQPDHTIAELYAACRAVVFPGEEDFGIVPVEAMASGKPVIAFARGGALETVVDRPEVSTGVLFSEQTVESLLSGVGRAREKTFDPDRMRAFAEQFDREAYKRQMEEYVVRRWSEFVATSRQPTRSEGVIGDPR